MVKDVDVRKDLVRLKAKIVKNPESYKDEFGMYLNHLKSSVEIFNLNPSKRNENLINLSFFISEMSKYYQQECKESSQTIYGILKKRFKTLHPETRLSFYKCLMLLFNNKMISSEDIIFISFLLLDTNDKELRSTVKTYLVKHMKTLRENNVPAKEISNLQSLIFKKLNSTSNPNAPRVALDTLCKIFRSNVASDSRIANVIAQACFHADEKVAYKAVAFLLGKKTFDIDDDSDAKNDPALANLEMLRAKAQEANQALKVAQSKLKITQKTKSAKKKVENLKKLSKNAYSSYNDFDDAEKVEILDKIYDPFTFCEKLIAQIQTKYFNHDFKLMQCELACKLIGAFGLFMPNIYPLLESNIKIGRKDATKYMYFAALTIHPLLPLEVTQNLIHIIAFNFATEGSRSEHVTYGLNTIRIICSRHPDAMTPEMLETLVPFRSYKEQPVSSSAKALINFFREVNPKLLPKKYRGVISSKTEHSDDSNEITSENEEYEVSGSEFESEEVSDATDEESSNDDGEEESIEELASNGESESDEDEEDPKTKKIKLKDIENFQSNAIDRKAKREENELHRKDKIRQKFKDWRHNPAASTTNKEKAKLKNNQMLIHKSKVKKAKKSWRQKASDFKTSLKKQRKHMARK